MATWVAQATQTAVTDGPPPVDWSSGSNTNITIAYALNVNGGITRVDINWAAASKNHTIMAAEFSGVNAASAVDVAKHGGGLNSSLQVATSLTTTNANDLVVYAINGFTASSVLPAQNAASSLPTTGWNALTGKAATAAVAAGASYQIFSATGTYTVAWDIDTGSPGFVGMCGMSFKGSGMAFVQQATPVQNAAGPTTTSITIPSTTAGNCVILFIAQVAASTSVNINSITDNTPTKFPVTFTPVPFMPRGRNL